MSSAAVLSILASLGVAVVAVLWGLNEGRGGGGANPKVVEEIQRAADADVNTIQVQLDRSRDEVERLKDEIRNAQHELSIEKGVVAELLTDKERLIARLDSLMAGGKPSAEGRDWTDEEIDQRNEAELMTVRIREQTLVAPLGYQMVDWEAMRKALGNSPRVVPESLQEAQSRAYAAMGFVPAGTEVRARSLDFLEGQQGAALYVGDHKMLFQTEGTTRSVHDRTALATELVRYMHDGSSSLFEKLGATSSNSDARQALWALSTGDVELVKLRYSVNQQNSSAAAADEFLQSPTRMTREQFDRIPAFVREEQLFPYALGKRFAQALHEEGKWGRINTALEVPPKSTAEILHPELYLAEEPFAPRSYSTLSIDAEVGGGLSPIWNDVAGEFRIALLLNQTNFLKRMADLGQPDVLDMPELVSKGYEHFAEREGSKAAEGWRGDRYLVYPTPGAEGESVYWRSHWASAEEAEEFASAIRASLAFRHKVEFPEDGGWSTGGKRSVKVAVLPDAEVVVIDAGRKDFGSSLEANFKQDSTQ